MIEIVYGRKFLLNMMPAHSICAEIGVDRGVFSEEILETVNPRKLHLIDPWDYYSARYDIVCRKFANRVESGQVQIHNGKSQLLYDLFPDEYFDWIYVDGSHSYKSVRNDLDLYYPKVKMYGFITGDDYRLVEKRRGLRDAVAEIAEKYLMRLILIQNNQYILWKKGPEPAPSGPLRLPKQTELLFE